MRILSSRPTSEYGAPALPIAGVRCTPDHLCPDCAKRRRAAAEQELAAAVADAATGAEA